MAWTAQRHREWSREWRARNKDSVSGYNRASKYGVTVEVYNAMLEEQGGVCAGCREEETATSRGVVRTLSVDHDHETGEVRGLLCQRCNATLGMARDDPEVLRRLIDYLGVASPTSQEALF